MLTINDQPWYVISIAYGGVMPFDFEDVKRVSPVDFLWGLEFPGSLAILGGLKILVEDNQAR
jgi:hypothetical protein